MLLTSISCDGHRHLVIGSSAVAYARVTRSLQAGASVIVITDKPASREQNEPAEPPAQQDGTEARRQVQQRRAGQSLDPLLPTALLELAESGSVELHPRLFSLADLRELGRPELGGFVDSVFLARRDAPGQVPASQIYSSCVSQRIPINTLDRADLSTFTLLAEHVDGPVRIGVSTSGRGGCRITSRIRREIASALPKGLGNGVEALARARRGLRKGPVESPGNALKQTGRLDKHSFEEEQEDNELDSPDDDGIATRRIGSPVDEAGKEESHREEENELERQRLWLAQISEYWPLSRIAQLDDSEVTAILSGEAENPASPRSTPISLSSLGIPASLPRSTKPHLALAGSGPGHPSLLTLSTVQALRSYPVILADKLVPGSIMSLIPRRTTVHIARKFPGNSTAGQAELDALAEAALKQGVPVLRLKQGDPFVFGRGGEEIDTFGSRGWPVKIIPGLSSATAALACAGLSITKRSLADGFEVRTGTARGGKNVDVPGYREGVTEVWLMAVHRLEGLVRTMLAGEEESSQSDDLSQLARPKAFTPYPASTPCMIVERASCSDQRVIRSTLAHIVEAVNILGGRPPGLFVVGRVCGEKTPGDWTANKKRCGQASPESIARWQVEEGWADEPEKDGILSGI